MADPNVIVKSNEVRQTVRVLTVRERESLMQSAEAHASILGATDRYQSGVDGPAPVLPPGLRVNRKKLNEQQAQIERVLKTCSPEPIPVDQRDAYARRAKDLEAKFKPYLETRAELHVLRRDKPEWRSAMDKGAKRLDPRNGIEAYIAEWQSIKRRLDPENPEADSLHDLRTDR